jgi:hypothetical protein
MSDHRYNYTSDDLSLNQAYSYNLLLQIDANAFSYAITFKNKLLAWGENYPLEELKDPQMLRDILTANYKQVLTGVYATGFTLWPSNLFEKDRVADIARLLDVNDNEKVYWQTLDDANVIVYKVDEFMLTSIADLDNQAVHYKAKGWINYISNSRPTEDELYVNISEETVEFAYFINRNLRFYNTFAFKSHEELTYYCAFVAGELKLQPQNISLILSGDINKTDRSFTYLEGFFNQVKLNNAQILVLPEQVVAHKVFTLAALLLCASSEEN